MPDAPTVEDESVATIPKDVADDSISAARAAALDILTDRETAVLSLRYGPDGELRLAFGAIARRLGMNRKRALTLHEKALAKLRAKKATRAFAESLEAAAPSEQRANPRDAEPVTPRAAIVVPPIEELLSMESEVSEAGEAGSETGKQGFGKQGFGKQGFGKQGSGKQGSGKQEFVEDESGEKPGSDDVPITPSPDSKGRGISSAAADEGKKNTSTKEADMARKKKTATRKKSASKKTASRGPGRRVDPAELARRIAVLKRVNAGEINNAKAAKELGMNYGTWAVWKSQYKKRTGGGGAPRPKKSATKRAARKTTAVAAEVAGLEQLVAQLRDMQAFRAELGAKLAELTELVERGLPG